jgi:carotenoid cleavage dioxygenase-like enzyme
MNVTVPRPRSIETIAPFRGSPEVRDRAEAVVTGNLPAWLRGELVRTARRCSKPCAGRRVTGFDGLCMIYAFRIGAKSVGFQSRLLGGEAAGGFRTAPRAWGRSERRPVEAVARLIQPIQRITDNTNVNVVKMGDDLVAMTEGDKQVRIDAQSLARARHRRVRARRPGRHRRGRAHPHFDFERGQVVNFTTKFGLDGLISIYDHAATERRRKVVASWRTRPRALPAFVRLTSRHAILVAHPLLVEPLQMLWSNRGFIDHFRWRPQEGTRLAKMNRATGALDAARDRAAVRVPHRERLRRRQGHHP